MKNAAFLSLLVLALAARPAAQHAAPHRTMTTAEVFGFHGPIRTQRRSTQILEKDPRSEPKLHILTLAREWAKFSPVGEIAEEGDFNSDGQSVNGVTRTYYQNGESAEIINGDKKTRYRTEKMTAQDGSEETKSYTDDVLQTWSIGRSDSRTNANEFIVFDANGDVISRTLSKRDKLVQDSQLWGKGGKFVIHTIRRMDDQGHTIQSDRFDQAGKLVSTMSFSNGELTSFWQDPLCDCTNVAAFRRPEGVSSFYKTEKDGRLYKDVQDHKGRPTNHEIDDEKLYDQNGQLLERLVYSYERDAHGNWTKRTISAFDLTTGNMVPIQRDTRELTYY
jgi:antitoxin component YwqK of YwqJK toxin-antitoxin module